MSERLTLKSAIYETLKVLKARSIFKYKELGTLSHLKTLEVNCSLWSRSCWQTRCWKRKIQFYVDDHESTIFMPETLQYWKQETLDLQQKYTAMYNHWNTIFISLIFQVFAVKVMWSDGQVNVVSRRYSEFFELMVWCNIMVGGF